MERKYLLNLRIKEKLTQEELASALGISTVYVRKIEKGVADPGRKTMIKYEKYFKTSMRKLFPDLFSDYSDKKLIKNKEVS